MDHYPVAVITDTNGIREIKAALAPFHHFETTGVVDKYVESVDMVETVRNEWESNITLYSYQYGDFDNYVRCTFDLPVVKVDREANLDINKKYKYGWITVNDNKEVVKVVNRSNPNSKWRKWSVGGIYRNTLVSTSGAKLNSVEYKNLTKAPEFFAVVKEDEWQSLLKVVLGGVMPYGRNNWPEDRDVLLATTKPTQWVTIVDCLLASHPYYVGESAPPEYIKVRKST